MYSKLIYIALITSSVSAFNTPVLSNQICRRNILNILSKSPMIIPYFHITECLAKLENKPLTEEEMKEYNKLLIEAERIRNIIDSNVNASKRALALDEENDLEKYLRKNGRK